MIHYFQSSIKEIALPDRFTYPFCYTPHPLCIKAAEEVQDYLRTQEQWADELAGGKMFGVLIVRTTNNEIGYLVAFSGNLAHNNKHESFVSPVFDLLDPKGFFTAEEKLISDINEEIDKKQKDEGHTALMEQLAEVTRLYTQKIDEAKAEMKQAKAERDNRRKANPDEKELKNMIRDSQFRKAELKRLERDMQKQLDLLREQLSIYTDEIGRLKEERKKRSFALQRKLFDNFRVLNAKGEEQGLYDIFERYAGKLPPAGAGECAAPKLLQYAYKSQMRPIAMAEFWWEPLPHHIQSEKKKDPDSTTKKGRRHGHYYPACKSKCEPILDFMMQGLCVEDNPLNKSAELCGDIEVIFEDEWIVIVNKPAGILSVPGKNNLDSVYSLMRKRYPDASGPLIVHRLDMDTSGLLIVAKTKDVHKEMQKLFASGKIEKCYIAILNGTIDSDEGEITLPICPDPEDRPRQIVSYKHGKPAITKYKKENSTSPTDAAGERLLLYPQTGRTHQLRVHSAHPNGLNTPIKGDRLYGTPSDRLYLHAKSLRFIHPITKEVVFAEKDANF